MARNKDHGKLLQVLSGEGGDYYIGTQAVSNKKFAAIRVGHEGATLVGVQLTTCDEYGEVTIGNQNVKTAKNYPASMPQNYLMIAGGTNYFNHIEFSAGYASGYLASRD